jgi:hypothetical protein
LETKLNATKVSNAQEQSQSVLKIVNGVPSKSTIATVNPNSYILDEVNGVLHVKGKTKTWKFQGVPE